MYTWRRKTTLTRAFVGGRDYIVVAAIQKQLVTVMVASKVWVSVHVVIPFKRHQVALLHGHGARYDCAEVRKGSDDEV